MTTTLQTMSDCEISWPSRPAGIGPSDGVAHIWAACLNVPESELRDFADVLAPDEKARPNQASTPSNAA